MSKVKLLVGLFGALVLAAVAIVFVLENQAQTHVELFGYLSPALPLSVLVLIAFMLGASFGLLMASVTAYKSRRRNGSL